MSEKIYTRMEIGGSILRNQIEVLADALNEDLENMNDVLGDDNIEEFISDYFSCNGFAEWGSCDETKKFCQENNLSYREYNEGKDDYEPTVTFWQPAMDEEIQVYIDHNERQVITVRSIKPFLDLYFDSVKGLTKHMDEPVLKDIINECLSTPNQALDIIEKKIRSLFPPEVPDLPNFVIHNE